MAKKFNLRSSFFKLLILAGLAVLVLVSSCSCRRDQDPSPNTDAFVYPKAQVTYRTLSSAPYYKYDSTAWFGNDSAYLYSFPFGTPKLSSVLITSARPKVGYRSYTVSAAGRKLLGIAENETTQGIWTNYTTYKTGFGEIWTKITLDSTRRKGVFSTNDPLVSQGTRLVYHYKSNAQISHIELQRAAGTIDTAFVFNYDLNGFLTEVKSTPESSSFISKDELSYTDLDAGLLYTRNGLFGLGDNLVLVKLAYKQYPTIYRRYYDGRLFYQSTLTRRKISDQVTSIVRVNYYPQSNDLEKDSVVYYY